MCIGHTDVLQEVKQQIAAMILTPTNKITLIFELVQRQQDVCNISLLFSKSKQLII